MSARKTVKPQIVYYLRAAGINAAEFLTSDVVKDTAYALGSLLQDSDVIGVSTAANLVSGLIKNATGEVSRVLITASARFNQLKGLFDILLNDLKALGYCLDMKVYDAEIGRLTAFLLRHAAQTGWFTTAKLITLVNHHAIENQLTELLTNVLMAYTNLLTQAMLVVYGELRSSNVGRFGRVPTPSLVTFMDAEQRRCGSARLPTPRSVRKSPRGATASGTAARGARSMQPMTLSAFTRQGTSSVYKRL